MKPARTGRQSASGGRRAVGGGVARGRARRDSKTKAGASRPRRKADDARSSIGSTVRADRGSPLSRPVPATAKTSWGNEPIENQKSMLLEYFIGPFPRRFWPLRALVGPVKGTNFRPLVGGAVTEVSRSIGRRTRPPLCPSVRMHAFFLFFSKLFLRSFFCKQTKD